MVNVFGETRRGGMRGPRGPEGPMGPTGHGKRGPVGRQGPPGPEGPPGKIGKIGPRGERGEIGPQGQDGKAGPRGERGDVGPQGQDGKAGPRGERGDVGPKGEKGSKGDRGEEGKEGPRGEQGSKGDSGSKGERGEAGPRGERGDVGPKGEKGSKGDRGEEGKEGPRGEQGSKGDSGPKGERGEAGSTGDRGEEGKEGPRGERGPQGERGPRGERGRSGKSDALVEMCKWMPHLILENLQMHEEQCCLFIEDLRRDIERDNDDYIRKWFSRTGKGNALSPGMRASVDLVAVPKAGRKALSFHRKETEYIIYDLPLLYHDKTSYGYICVTFRTSSAEDQALLTNYRDSSSHFVEIYATDQVIGIKLRKQGSSEIFHYPIQHHNEDWTTFYLEYSRGGDTGKTAFKYYINNSEESDGEFSAEYDADTNDFLLGGRFDETHWFKGEIASLETYHKWDSKDDKPHFIPACLRQLIRENQYVYNWK